MSILECPIISAIDMTEGEKNWSAKEIKDTVHDMQDVVAGNPFDTLETRFGGFKMRYPGLYLKASKKMSKTDWDILDKMLDQLKGIEDKEIEHYDSSVCVGQDLVDRFVKPRLPPPSRD